MIYHISLPYSPISRHYLSPIPLFPYSIFLIPFLHLPFVLPCSCLSLFLADAIHFWLPRVRCGAAGVPRSASRSRLRTAKDALCFSTAKTVDSHATRDAGGLSRVACECTVESTTSSPPTISSPLIPPFPCRTNALLPKFPLSLFVFLSLCRALGPTAARCTRYSCSQWTGRRKTGAPQNKEGWRFGSASARPSAVPSS